MSEQYEETDHVLDEATKVVAHDVFEDLGDGKIDVPAVSGENGAVDAEQMAPIGRVST